VDVSGLGATHLWRLEISNLRREFGEVVALEDASLSVGAGEIAGLVGRNGAGKTTLMRSVMGIIGPDRGTITWDGHPIGQTDRLLLPACLLFFALGYALYAFAFAAAGATVARQEEVQITTIPLTIPLLVGYLLASVLAGDPHSPAIAVLSFVPPLTPSLCRPGSPSAPLPGGK